MLKEESQRSERSVVEQIMELVQRADTVTVKSEGTRVLGNVVKTLFADLSSTDPSRKTAQQRVVTPGNANALAALIGRSKKYPMLVNEGVVALSFLTTHGRGGESLPDLVRHKIDVMIRCCRLGWNYVAVASGG